MDFLQESYMSTFQKDKKRSTPLTPQYQTSIHMRGRDCAGFTLLELIVSITLTSFLVLILSMAMRSGLRAYERAKGLSDDVILKTSITNLLDRQLRMIVSMKNPNTKAFFRLNGYAHSVVFTTTSGPSGAKGGGLLLVSYNFNQEKKVLTYCQKIVTRPIDIKENPPEELSENNLSEIKKGGWDCDIVTQFEDLAFKYTSKKHEIDIESWNDEWNAKRALPVAIAIGIKNNWTPFYLNNATN